MSLVELTRATEDEYGVATGSAPISLTPEHVAVFFQSETSQMQTVARLANGHGFKLFGAYAEVAQKFAESHRFVELTRTAEMQHDHGGDGDDYGEDDGIVPPSETETAAPLMISFNPSLIAAVHGDRINGNVTIVKMRDGRGFKVRGNYAEVKAKLEAPLN